VSCTRRWHGRLTADRAKARSPSSSPRDARNREVAAQLLLSARATEAHVRNVDAELGMCSRVGLARDFPAPQDVDTG
jgi:hypothetical protein